MKFKAQLFLFILLNTLHGQVDYTSQIQTIFSSDCTGCHGNSGGLNLTSYSNLMAGGNSGAVIVANDHANSLLWQKVNTGEMPQNNPALPQSQIDLIALWINEGALEFPVTTFQPQTTAALQTAVDLWVSDSASAVATYGDISTWDVSLITDMSELFKDKTTFNDDISNWDVSSVTSMTHMFNGAGNFNGDISNWDVSNVNGMGYLFNDADSFNQDISSWDVSNAVSYTHLTLPTNREV